MKLLTKRKQKWAGKRRDVSIKGSPLNLPSMIEARYVARLSALVQEMCDITIRDCKRFFNQKQSKEYIAAAMDASLTDQAQEFMDALTAKIMERTEIIAEPLAESMCLRIDAQSSRMVHASMQKLSGGLSLPTSALKGVRKDVLYSSVAEQTALIKSIPTEYLGKVAAAVQRSIAAGRGLADLIPFLEQQTGITHRRARMIALDQTRKAYNNMNRARLQDLGMEEYEWLHTGGSNKPRKDHVEMSGNIYRFDDPPVIDAATGERGIPGQAINCRCRMVPVLRLSNGEQE